MPLRTKVTRVARKSVWNLATATLGTHTMPQGVEFRGVPLKVYLGAGTAGNHFLCLSKHVPPLLALVRSESFSRLVLKRWADRIGRASSMLDLQGLASKCQSASARLRIT